MTSWDMIFGKNIEFDIILFHIFHEIFFYIQNADCLYVELKILIHNTKLNSDMYLFNILIKYKGIIW